MRAVAAAVMGATLAACGRGPAPAPAAAGDAGFLMPPVVLRAEPRADGGVRLLGRAPPDALVRLVSPDGRALGATADPSGGWGADLPAVDAPQMFALSADLGGRTLRAEGALALTPPSARATALLARAGAPAVPLGARGTAAGGPQIAAVDFDRGGGLAVAGRAAAGARLRLQVDGAAMGDGQADGSGRFGLLDVGGQATGTGAPARSRRVRVEAADGAADALEVDTGVPAPLAGPFRAARAAGGWRVDWAPPGGGVQSLFLPDAPAATQAPAAASAPGAGR